MIHTVIRATVIVSSVLLLSCSGSAPPRIQYLLRGELTDTASRVETPLRVGLGRVTLASYLDQAGIVLETEAGQVTAARYHQWAEPLDAGLRSYLRSEVSRALGYEVCAQRGERVRWDYTVDVYIDRLHGSMGGTAVIDASYRIIPEADDAAVAEYRFAGSAHLASEGYDGLVDAEAQLTSELAAAIAESVREISAR